MRAEVMAIGDELTSGQRLDTNSQWISQRLEELGVAVMFHTTVGDDAEVDTQVFREAARRADIVVCTGGLGPTADDLTREAIAAATGNDLVLDEEALEHIRGLFARRRRREMPERNRVQAMFPRGSRVIPNPHGTAPGIDIAVPRPDQPPSRIFALPGVPAEMHEMWHQTVQPAVLAMLGNRRNFIRNRSIKCFGVGESDLEAMLPDLIRRGRQPRVGITVSRATITLRITASGPTPEACDQLIDPTAATIRECLGDLVFGEEEDELQDAVARLLAARGQTLSTVDCGSGGLMADWMSDADAARNVYRGGWVLRDQENSAEAMTGIAQRCRQQFQTDWALVVGPFPESDAGGGTPGDLHLALSGAEGLTARSTTFAGHPDLLKHRAVKLALDLLRLKLLRG
ncbi:MAG: CinA family nicotinamide mononucleotide deamidase-related protein [Planctomycetes bacterium]|nr:CinA family nicotinamide mononucleotide deamidase-related protein [Planctomycetota bacterium]